jgi:hypothetical protein
MNRLPDPTASIHHKRKNYFNKHFRIIVGRKTAGEARLKNVNIVDSMQLWSNVSLGKIHTLKFLLKANEASNGYNNLH